MKKLQRLTFVLGGAASGKSAFAEDLVTQAKIPRVYIATAQAFDAEMAQKIARHRADRGPDWVTIEAPRTLPQEIGKVSPGHVTLVDCVTLWLSNRMLDPAADLEADTRELLDALSVAAGPLVVVSNEVGHGVVPDNALARRFRNAQGRLNREIAARADTVVAVMAGLPLALKGELP